MFGPIGSSPPFPRPDTAAGPTLNQISPAVDLIQLAIGQQYVYAGHHEPLGSGARLRHSWGT